LTAIEWHGFSAYKLENEAISTIIVPEMGGKIASIYDKRAGHEWLAEPTHPPRERIYGDTFTKYELSGWDEMFPTIDACAYPLDTQISLPDHGEVWALPWEVLQLDESAVHLGITGQALSYRLERDLQLTEQGIKLRYTLSSQASEPIIFIWAAHPLFYADEHTRILFPEEVKSLLNILALDAWGTVGQVHSWPNTNTMQGTPFSLDRIGSPELKDYRKFYIAPDEPIGWAGLKQEDKNCTLKLLWNPDELPYCGLWIDEGTFTAKTTVAPEPSNAYYDDLGRAYAQKRYGHLQPNESLSWEIDIQLSH
jgi:galactose mutarotase-like enzyme